MASTSPRRDSRHARPALLALNPSGLFSGAEVALLRLLDTARAEGWGVTVGAPAGPLARKLEAGGFSRFEIPELRFSEHRRPVALALAALRSTRLAARLRRAAAAVDVVLVNGLHALPATRLARLRPPVVWF